MLALTVQGFIGSYFMIGIPFLLPVSIRALDDAILGMAGCFKIGKANSSKAGNSQRNTGNVQFPVFFGPFDMTKGKKSECILYPLRQIRTG